MRVCLIGGARSGKSAYAQSLIEERVESVGASVLVVTFGRSGCDDEFDRRIEHHRSTRPADWDVLELGNEDLGVWDTRIVAVAEKDYDVVLVDCVATLLSCVIDDLVGAELGADWYERPTLDEDLSGPVIYQTLASARKLAALGTDCVFVTNEVGMAPIAPSAAGRLFVDSLGWINQELSALCDESYLIVAGQALALHTLSQKPSGE
jgi:adenosyl cobinamide kinase/adenosyl cobinamide phosphate guanylyltransferase